MAHSDRRTLFRALSLALFPKAFRTLSGLMDSPRSAPKAIELLARMHGMLIDRVKSEDPDGLKELLARLRERKTVESYTPSSDGEEGK